MVELIFRLSILVAATAASALAPGADFDLSWKIAAALAAVGSFSFLLERKGMKTADATALQATIDMAGVSVWIASCGELSRYGFVILAPAAYAISKQRVPTQVVAPIAGFLLLLANYVAGRLPTFAPILIAQAMLIIAVCLLIGRRVEPAAVQPVVHEMELKHQPMTMAGDDYLQIRENYRTLKERFRELERRSERDKLVRKLFELRNLPSEILFPRLAEAIADLTGSDGAAIFGVAQTSEALVVRGATTDFPDELAERSFSIEAPIGERDLKSRLDMATRAVPAAERRDFANVLLMSEGNVVGLICVAQSDVESLRICREKAEDAAEFVTAFLLEETDRQSLDRRLVHAELLYSIATLTAGTSNATALAERVVGQLGVSLGVDSVAIHRMGNGDSELLANEGSSLHLSDALQFETGSGIAAWIRAGAPEICLFDARNDSHCQPEAALKRRIGSYSQFAIRGNDGVIGFVTAATNRVGGIDLPQVDTLRVIASELSRAFSNLGSGVIAEDLISGDEFRKLVSRSAGSLVALEILHTDKLRLTHGRVELEDASRRLLSRLRAQLPEGGVIFRKDESEYYVFLVGVEEAFASSWANDATATAALIGVPKLDLSGETPLALRAKVAQIVPNRASETSRLSA